MTTELQQAQEMIYSCHVCNIHFTAMSFKAFRAATGSNIKCPLCGDVAVYVADLSSETKEKYSKELMAGEQEIQRESKSVRIPLGFDGVRGEYTNIVRETEKAILVERCAYSDGAKVMSITNWLPKSQVKQVSNYISIPMWLYAKGSW